MEERQQRRRKILWYGGFGAGLALLIGILWARYAATQRLLTNLSSRDMEVRVAAARRLLETEQLADSLPAQPILRRVKTAEALERLATPAAIKQLITMLKDPDDPVSKRAWRALGRIGKKAAKDLDPVLKDADAKAKNGSIEAFVLMGSQAISTLARALKDKDKRPAAATALRRIGGKPPWGRGIGRALEPLLKAAADKNPKMVDLRSNAITELGEAREARAVPFCLDALSISSLQQPAIRALGLLADKRAARPIIPFLKNKALRVDSARALGQISDPVAVEPLLRVLRQEDVALHQAGVWALRMVGRPAVAALLRCLTEPNLNLRRAAVEALLTAHDPQTVPALVRALRDPDPQVREAAALALGWEGNAAAVPHLTRAFDDPNWRIPDAATVALAKVREPAVGPLISLFAARMNRRREMVRALYASRALVKMGEPALPSLIQAARSPSPSIRRWAGITLGDMGSPHASPASRP